MTKSSKLISTDNIDEVEGVINNIVREEKKQANNIFSDAGSTNSFNSLASRRKLKMFETGESPQFGCPTSREGSLGTNHGASIAQQNIGEELQNAYIKNNNVVNLFNPRNSAFSFMGSEGSSQTSESNYGSGGVQNLTKNVPSDESKATPQFSKYSASRVERSSSGFRSISSSSPFKNTLTQKAEMVKMQKGNFLAQDVKENQSKRNSALLQKSHISISSIYTMNSGAKERNSSAVMSYAIQLADAPKSQIISSLSILNDPSGSEKHDFRIASSESIQLKTEKEQWKESPVRKD
mmetsp:Transcript_5367/g.4556  ORF Transcript_5367/g.4556 Transcript_5367/m.4556 type:complete len:294 (+) Transcript_5367:611-1492(+)